MYQMNTQASTDTNNTKTELPPLMGQCDRVQLLCGQHVSTAETSGQIQRRDAHNCFPVLCRLYINT